MKKFLYVFWYPSIPSTLLN